MDQVLHNTIATDCVEDDFNLSVYNLKVSRENQPQLYSAADPSCYYIQYMHDQINDVAAI